MPESHENIIEDLKRSILDRLDRHSDKLENSWNLFFSSLLTLNGLFLALFSAIVDKSKLSTNEIIIFSTLNLIAVLLIIFMFGTKRYFSVKKFEKAYQSSQEHINTIANGKNYTYNRENDSRLKKKAIFFHYINKVFEWIIVACTIISIILIFIYSIKSNARISFICI